MKIKDYAEDSLPVLNRKKKMVGIITAQDVIETVDDEMGDDYAKLAGLSSEEDLNETTKESMKKRLPWLIILLFLGMGVSAVVGAFEGVVAVLPVFASYLCFLGHFAAKSRANQGFWPRFSSDWRLGLSRRRLAARQFWHAPPAPAGSLPCMRKTAAKRPIRRLKWQNTAVFDENGGI